MPNQHQTKSYYDGVAPIYDNLYQDGISLAENALVDDALRKITERGQKILDLGCGTGLGYSLISNSLGKNFNYVGLDISPKMIQKAKEKLANPVNAIFLIKDASDLSCFKTDEFDSIISLFGSFSHILNPVQTIDEIKRVLKPNGMVFIMVYSRFSLRNLLKALTKFSAKSLQEIGPYSIRNAQASDSAAAKFYTQKSCRQFFKNFSQLSISGLNAFLEIPFFRHSFLPPQKSRAAKKFLAAENRSLRYWPELGHSLIIIGKNSKKDAGIDQIGNLN